MSPLRIKTVVVGPLETNCYLVADEATGECAIIDPGEDARRISDAIERHEFRPALILLTHAHFDHTGAVAECRERYGARIGVSAAEAPALEDGLLSGAQLFGFPFRPSKADFTIAEGDDLPLGESTLRAIETPGHSAGGLTFLGDDFALVGDVLFRDGIGRYDLPGSDVHRLTASLARLLELPDATRVYPGHGPVTTIGREKDMNPHLSFLGLGGHRPV
jgi:glyoxylase-like metal-dependent hydrolase (beta-lactamase superfamily II)